MSQPSEVYTEVRGHSRFDRSAGIALRFLSWFTDLLFALVVVELIYSHSGSIPSSGMDPLLDGKFLGIFLAAFLIPTLVGRRYAGGSLGERIWKIRRGLTRARESSDKWRGSILTLILLVFVAGVYELKIATHPYWATSDELHLVATTAPGDWRVLAFYYTLAPWPVSFQGQPIFYSIPYEVGPPKRFIGHIESDWKHGSVRLTIEGPKTPLEFQSRSRTRHELRDCFMNSPWLDLKCVEVRRITLERHLDELKAGGYTKFETMWFTADNQAVSDDQRAQGVRLRAHAGERTQDRYIFITPQGLHETVALSYLENDDGQFAEREFKTALGALRISEDLAPGRMWTDQLLQSTNLDRLLPGYLESLAQVQSILISKISVDPAGFDAYYHLAGSDLLLLKYCAKNPDLELKSLAQAMVDRLNHYAHDVSQKDPRLQELEHLAHDARQF